jgi:hypothetical protein
LDVTADGALAAVVLGAHDRWRLGQPDELGMAVRQASAGFAAFIKERVHVGKSRFARRARPLAPGGCDAVDLVLAQLRERVDVARCRNDDLVMLEDRIEVRDNANRPARRVPGAATRPDREDLRRRPVLPAFAERAGDELFLGREVEIGPRVRSRPLRTARRDDDPLAGDRVLAELRLQLEAPPPFFFSMKGLRRSIGAGKTIVVDCEEPSSSRVCK